MMLSKNRWITLALLLPVLSLTSQNAYSNATYRYRLRMANSDVGSATVTVQRGKMLHSSTHVLMRLKQAGRSLRVELSANLLSDLKTYAPSEYRLSVFTNGEKQAEIQVIVKGRTAQAEIQTPQTGSTKLKVALKPGTLILDNNFCLDHYQAMLWRFLKSGQKQANYPFLVPQILIGNQRLFTISLTKAAVESTTVGDTTLSCQRIDARTDTGLEMQFWVRPDDGLLLKWAIPAQRAEVVYDFQGNPEQRASLELDLNEYYRDLIEKLYIPAYTDLGDWRRVEYLKLRAKFDIVAMGTPTTSTPWQTFEGECTVLEGRASYDGIFTITMVRPDRPGVWLGHTPPDSLRTWLRPEPAIQSNHPAIRALADSLRATCKTPLDMVETVCAWIHNNVQYELTGSDALTCLQSRRGDCGPQSFLAIALLRSLGIPARIAGGLLYVGGRFGQHNWVEAYLGPEAGWIPVDPTTGETRTFSAAHLTLWRGWAGTLHPQPKMARIEVLEFRKLPENDNGS